MKQLTALDNMFLGLEHGNQTMHVASLGIYDPSTAPGGKVRFKQILAHYAAKLDALKLYQRRLVKVPLDLDLPYWVDQGEIDLEYHVRHIALPQPGDWRQLMIQVARLHSRPLDLTKPLWETYVIEGLDHVEGLPKGCFAIYAKLHHALVDGEAAAEMIRLQHDLAPVGRPVDQLVTHIADSVPQPVELLSRAVTARAGRWVSNARTLGSLTVTAARMAGEALSGADPRGALLKLEDALVVRNPPTRFGGDISPNRVVNGLPLPLDGFAEIRRAVPDTTINDVFLAVSSGAVRKYLAHHGELPAASLHASVPVSTHGKVKSADAGNSVSGTMVELATHIEAPVERLRAVHAGMERSKQALAALGQDLMRKLSQLIPLAPINLVQRHILAPRASIIVSNVRGPSVPLYFAGARLVRFMPVSIASNGMGLNITGFSYDNQLWVCVVSCRKMMPDPDFFAQCLQESFAELHAAATTDAVPKATKDAAPKAAPKTATKAAKGAAKGPAKGAAKRRAPRSAVPPPL